MHLKLECSFDLNLLVLLQIWLIGQWAYNSRYETTGIVADLYFDYIVGIRVIDQDIIDEAQNAGWILHPTPFTIGAILHNWSFLQDKCVVRYSAPMSVRQPSGNHWVLNNDKCFCRYCL